LEKRINRLIKKTLSQFKTERGNFLMKRNRIFSSLLVVVLAIALMGCGTTPAAKPADKPADKTETSDAAKKPSVTMKLSTTSSKGGAHYEGAIKFKELVEKNSNGDMEVQVFPDGQLAKDLAAIDAHKTGAIEMSLPSTVMAQIDPKFGVFDIPFLFKDSAAVKKFAHGPMWEEDFQPLFDKYGMVGLGFWENGFRQITNNVRPINVPEDLKGIKMRVPESKLRVAMFKEFGANPSTADFSEVFTALQQGVFDGQENPLTQIEAGRFYEVQKYLSITNHTYTPAYLVASKVWFDKLTTEQQEIIKKAAVEAGDYSREYGSKIGDELIAKFKKAGMIVNTADGEAFQAKTKPVIDLLKKSIDPAFVDKVVKAAKG